MIYVNDCSIRVVQSFIKKFCARNFRTSFCIQKLFYNKKKANYGSYECHGYCIRVITLLEDVE